MPQIYYLLLYFVFLHALDEKLLCWEYWTYIRSNYF